MTLPEKMDPYKLEKYSSAVSLSDMEIFIFPELLYSLVLANIMSPLIWEWRNAKWFDKVKNKTTYRKVLRLKQFIINRFDFNLDLETWGLTDKQTELNRFSSHIDLDILRESNALFGYTGDRYYFDLDIRRHFGLDKYNSDQIPYWKTETVEAMNAFQFKPHYANGAGECVSLSTLYAAALFVICEIPLEDIFLMTTPLHSQNFINVRDGIITNNRRIVTKTMWFNGSELSAKAQRALRNERVTVVSNNTGYIHSAYPVCTISEDDYDRFSSQISEYLSSSKISFTLLANFFRHHAKFQKLFQISHERHGQKEYLPLEIAFCYEHDSKYHLNKQTHEHLLEEIDEEDFSLKRIADRICVQELQEYLQKIPPTELNNFKLEQFSCELNIPNKKASALIAELHKFLHLKPRLPSKKGKEKRQTEPLFFEPGASRNEIIDYLESMRSKNSMADLAFYAYRDLSRTSWEPFLKAAIERNPVCITETDSISDNDLENLFKELPNESIYSESRMAQPDEVWNYQRGDGLEKAIALASIWKSRHPTRKIVLDAKPDKARLDLGEKSIEWPSKKGLTHRKAL